MTIIGRNGNMQHKILPQRGYAMLGIIALIGVAATAVIVTSFSATAVHNEQVRKTSSALALAKQALIASAASSNTHPGSLPCPDTDNDGLADPVSGACQNLIGRLPWQTLGLPDLRDSSGERLWYVLSQQFTDSNVVNSKTTGELGITGTISATNAAAIVFAPGASVNGQQRNPAQINSVSQYLESYVNPTSFSTSEANGSYNDQLMVISTTDIFLVVERRVAKEVQAALQNYSDLSISPGKLPPYALSCTGSGPVSCPKVAPMLSPGAPVPSAGTLGYIPTDEPSLTLPGWFSANDWNLVMTYRVDSDCAAGLACGSAFTNPPYPPGTSDGILIGFSGGTANAGTKAVLSFAGVNTGYPNYPATVLNAALQVQAH